jgi:transcriptional regulator with XRE-family HTH domain
MNQHRNIVGPVVRELRQKKGLTQPQLVAKLNIGGWDVSRETLAKIETQIRWVADFEIGMIAVGLEIEAPELLRMAFAHKTFAHPFKQKAKIK